MMIFVVFVLALVIISFCYVTVLSVPFEIIDPKILLAHGLNLRNWASASLTSEEGIFEKCKDASCSSLYLLCSPHFENENYEKRKIVTDAIAIAGIKKTKVFAQKGYLGCYLIETNPSIAAQLKSRGFDVSKFLSALKIHNSILEELNSNSSKINLNFTSRDRDPDPHKTLTIQFQPFALEKLTSK